MQACLNGARGSDEHPAIAVNPEACAAEALAAVEAGADDLHIHPRTDDGRDSLVADDVARWVGAVRAVCDLPVGVTTGAWAWCGGLSAAQAVRSWSVLPDHASVNWHEGESERIATAVLDRGIRLHAGLWTEESARQWAESSWPEHTACVLLELSDSPDQTDLARRLVDLVVGRLGDREVPILLHGEGLSAWPALDCAVAWGVQARIGLEDVLVGPDDEEVGGNADLLHLAARR